MRYGSVSEEYVKSLRKNGDIKTARRYEEGLYNNLGAIDIDVVDNLLAEVIKLREEVEQWESLARAYAKILKSTNLPPELIEDVDISD